MRLGVSCFSTGRTFHCAVGCREMTSHMPQLPPAPPAHECSAQRHRGHVPQHTATGGVLVSVATRTTPSWGPARAHIPADAQTSLPTSGLARTSSLLMCVRLAPSTPPLCLLPPASLGQPPHAGKLPKPASTTATTSAPAAPPLFQHRDLWVSQPWRHGIRLESRRLCC
jgi:hypothetical protein